MSTLWTHIFRISASNRIYIVVLTYLLSTQILTVIASSQAVKPNNQQSRSDGRWYDKSKWSNSASTKSYASHVEGSGSGDVVSDLDDSPKGLGPDDEDSADVGSGGSPLHETAEEGSGAGPMKVDFDTSTTSSISARTTVSTYSHSTTENMTTKVTIKDHEVHTVSAVTNVPFDQEATVGRATTAASTTLSAAILVSTTTQRWPPEEEETGKGEDDDTDDDDDDDDDDDEIDDVTHYPVPPHLAGGVRPPVVDIFPPTAVPVTPVVQPVMTPTRTTVVPFATVSTKPHDIYDEAPPPPIDTRGTTLGDRWGLDWLLNPGVLTAVIGGAFVGLLAAILLVMLVVYRMRKKDEGSYVLEEPKAPPSYPYAYQKAPAREFYA